jgi:hypothetical protein
MAAGSGPHPASGQSYSAHEDSQRSTTRYRLASTFTLASKPKTTSWVRVDTDGELRHRVGQHREDATAGASLRNPRLGYLAHRAPAIA